MSNADDRPCPDCGETADPHLCDGRRQVVRRHTEPAPQPEPCPRCGDELPASMCQPQPAPSGDEAKVRACSHCGSETVSMLSSSTVCERCTTFWNDGYAAGKADGARDNERDMVEYLLGLADDSEGRVTDALRSGRWREELAIARRGSEGT